MQRNIRDLNWFLVERAFNVVLRRVKLKLKKTKTKLNAVCGVPRGGLPMAVWFSHHMDLPMALVNPVTTRLPNNGEGWLVCDDICDSGATAEAVRELNPKATIVTMIGPMGYERRSYVDHIGIAHDANTWWVFPWEKNSKARKDYFDYKRARAKGREVKRIKKPPPVAKKQAIVWVKP
jgi:adenine/guanine phosphoribosyltransferase-like PRPP-binding protein